MRKVLYGTTALVAAGLAAGQASADGGIKLGISGYYRAAAGFLVGGDQTQTGANSGQGDFDRTSGAFRQEIRINFKGSATLDNGITVGVLVGVNAENNASSGSGGGMKQNRSYVEFAGKYGDLRFGEGAPVDALKANCVFDPGNVTSNFGVNSANVGFANLSRRAAAGANATVGVGVTSKADATCDAMSNKGTSVVYFTPSFGGFSLAVSYTPESGHRLASGSQGYGPGTDLENVKAENILGASANYTQSFGGGWSFTAGGGGEWGLSDGNKSTGASLPGNKPSSYILGFQVGIPGGFKAGASGEYYVNYPNNTLLKATDAGTSGADGWSVSAGASYSVDAVSLGLEGIFSQYQTWQGCSGLGGGGCPVGATPGHDDIWAVALTGAYALGPGISLEGMVAYSKYDPNFGTPSATNPMEYDAVEIDGGVAVNF